MGGDVVVKPALAMVWIREMEVLHLGALAGEVGRQFPERLLHSTLADEVGVVGEDNTAAVQGDVAPLGESDLAPRWVGSDPVPDAEHGDAHQAMRDRRVSLPGTFGNEQRHRRVAHPVPDGEGYVDTADLAERRLVLARLVIHDPRSIGPVLVAPGAAVEPVERN